MQVSDSANDFGLDRARGKCIIPSKQAQGGANGNDKIEDGSQSMSSRRRYDGKPMRPKKNIYETKEVKAFANGMSAVSRRKYDIALQTLRDVGFLRYPMGEKVEGHDDIFAIRIVSGGNERFFYCYDDGDVVVVLHGYSKTTRKIPVREIEKALCIRDRLFGGGK